MIEPTKADIGRSVLYRPRHPAPPEPGTLVSFNSLFAFVRFGAGTTPQGCRFADLEWEFPAGAGLDRGGPAG